MPDTFCPTYPEGMWVKYFRWISVGSWLLLGCTTEPDGSPASAGASGNGADAEPGGGHGGENGTPGGHGGEAGQGAVGGFGAAAGQSGAAGSAGIAGSAGMAGQTGSGSTGLYEPCTTTPECLPGLHCQSHVPEPQGGLCSHACTSHDDCENTASGKGICHPVTSTCVLGCGINPGQCPDGLVCTDSQFCVEKSSLAASKNTGQSCATELECLHGAACISGEHTSAYCSPPCQNDEDCKTGAPEAVGSCKQASGLTFCIYLCGIMANGAACPGDLTCEFGMCR